jgi:hypothetical protein
VKEVIVWQTIKDAEHLKSVAAELFNRLGKNDEVRRKTEKFDVSFKFKITDHGY